MNKNLPNVYRDGSLEQKRASKDHKRTAKILVKNTGKGSAYFEPGANNLRSGLSEQ